MIPSSFCRALFVFLFFAAAPMFAAGARADSVAAASETVGLDVRNLILFSELWQQAPANETGFQFNLYADDILDERDLLLLIAQWKTVPEMTIVLPNLPQGAKPLALRLIPPGRFMMGRYPWEQDSSINEDFQHRVDIAYSFFIGRHEITKA